jgi:UDP-N-acetylmuramate dehydrogenase
METPVAAALPAGAFRVGVPLAPLTTLRIGGPAATMVEAEREADVEAVALDAGRRGDAIFVLGEGSNVVVGDEGVSGLTLRMKLRGLDARREGHRVIVEVAAGESWDALVARAADEGWRGLECMSGIPGLVGGTPIQNVGAYGQEVADTVTRVRAFDRASGSFVELDRDACRFGYRASVFKRSERWIVTSVRFELEAGESSSPLRYAELLGALGVPEGATAPLARVRETVLALRRGKGMVLDAGDPDSVSAGSFFVNPVVEASLLSRVEARTGEKMPRHAVGGGRFKLAAAWLVERAGFPRGWGEGRVGVSRKHALALVNRGGASARELLAVARTIRDGVHRRFGVELEPEPVMVGCSWR